MARVPRNFQSHCSVGTKTTGDVSTCAVTHSEHVRIRRLEAEHDVR